MGAVGNGVSPSTTVRYRDGGSLLVHAIIQYSFLRGRGNIIFPVQLTTSRVGNLTRLIHTLLYVMTIHMFLASGTLLVHTIALPLRDEDRTPKVKNLVHTDLYNQDGKL